MRQKIEIKVYLPIKMVGELETRRKAGLRSKFVEEAIRNHLDDESEFNVRDIDNKRLMAALIGREGISEFVKSSLRLEMKE
jgi:metal-responsive CopG/Arc/MetJ family transcriptional regulator